MTIQTAQLNVVAPFLWNTESSFPENHVRERKKIVVPKGSLADIRTVAISERPFATTCTTKSTCHDAHWRRAASASRASWAIYAKNAGDWPALAA